jgi:hypothetical protein
MESINPPAHLIKRFHDGYLIDPDGGCWVWQRNYDSNGYGRHLHWKAHRFAWLVLVGPIADGLQLDHLCRNRGCVNPTHLEPVTQRENLLRGETIYAANAAKTHCKYGHEFTPENTRIIPRGRRCRACERRRSNESHKRKLARQ